MSNISAVYRNDGAPAGSAPEFDRDSAAGLERYLAQCKEADRHLTTAIDALVDSRRPILVWGVGTHTGRLMSTSRLAEADIVAFIESNSRYHGRTLHGRP